MTSSIPTKKTPTKVRIGMLSLGCPKTLVDSENILGKLSGAEYELTATAGDCDIALLNTCSFIKDAQEESIDKILELIELKKQKQIRAIIVMGCLVQRYPKELQKEFLEVDAFVGSGDYAKIPEVVQKVYAGDRVFTVHAPGYLATSGESRVALTPKHYRYVKISEGCDHTCAFCTIPSFRGKHRSRPLKDVLGEIETLVREGTKEIVLTGQDTTYYGRDFDGKFHLPRLISEIDKIKGLKWLRLLYAYPSCIPTALMEAMRDSKKMVHYLDMPLQHTSDAMLLAMKRGITKRRTTDLIYKFREYVPDLAIRTTMIVGFPGETDADFKEMLDFMREIKFERLGIFKYSQEEDTPAAEMPNQVPDPIKQERFERAMELQQEISADNNRRFLNQTLEVIIDEQDDEDPSIWKGRTYMDAPDVDGLVYVQSKRPLVTGDIIPVRITETKEYDLVGTLQT